LFYLLLTASQIPAQQTKAELKNYGLVVRGQVTDLEFCRHPTYCTDKNQTKFDVKLKVEFSNEGSRPIIFFAPAVDVLPDRYWLGGWSLSVNEDSEAENIFSDGYWESVSGGDYYKSLAEQLDAKAPPAKQTRVLQPGERWSFPDEFRISFDTESNQRFSEHRTWKEMQAFPMKLWLRIDYELSPWNVEFFRPDLIRRLQRRWKPVGNVLVERKREDRFNKFRISSEPMPIDFSQARSNTDQ